MDEQEGPPGGRDGEPPEPAGSPDRPPEVVAPDGPPETAAMRALVAQIGAAQAAQLRLVDTVVLRCTAEARQLLALSQHDPSGPSREQLVASQVTTELMVMLGISAATAQRMEALATRLVHVLPQTLDALEQGRIDLTRARVLAEATEVLDDDHARAVQDLVLPTTGDGPWDGPSPRTWRSRVERTVVKVDAGAARRRREIALAERAVRAWAAGDGTGALQIVGAAQHDVAMADQVVTDLAHAWPSVDPVTGEVLTMDQRRVDATMDLFRRVATGADLPTARPQRARDIGIVLHADTFFGDGPAKDDPGELRGLGAPAPIDPRSAAETARAEIGSGATTRVLLVRHDGTLVRTVRLPQAPRGGWTRGGLTRSVHEALPKLPPLEAETYEPTVTITEHVRAVHARCTSYDCARLAGRCDLDHDEEWPRGPTAATNLHPRCRRHHELKTRGLVRTRLRADGTVTTTTLLGQTVTTRPESLPGHGVGEAYRTERCT